LTSSPCADRRRYCSVLGCLGVAGLELGLSPSTAPAGFLVDASPSDAEVPVAEIVQRDAHRFTLTAPDLATCDVDLLERRIVVRSAAGREDDEVAHFVADDVLPRIASLAGRTLHAAALAVDGRAFVLLGPSGVGKSTLAARLALEGALLLGDDYAHITDGLVRPACRPSRLWPESAAFLGLPPLAANGTGKVEVSEPHGVVRGADPVPLQEVLVVDDEARTLDVLEALRLVLSETLRLTIPTPAQALEGAVDFLSEFGPRRTIRRDATLGDLRRL
jgi:hypothetical protein